MPRRNEIINMGSLFGLKLNSQSLDYSKCMAGRGRIDIFILLVEGCNKMNFNLSPGYHQQRHHSDPLFPFYG